MGWRMGRSPPVVSFLSQPEVRGSATARGSDATARATVGRTTAAAAKAGGGARCYFRRSAAFFTIAGGVW